MTTSQAVPRRLLPPNLTRLSSTRPVPAGPRAPRARWNRPAASGSVSKLLISTLLVVALALVAAAAARACDGPFMGMTFEGDDVAAHVEATLNRLPTTGKSVPLLRSSYAVCSAFGSSVACPRGVRGTLFVRRGPMRCGFDGTIVVCNGRVSVMRPTGGPRFTVSLTETLYACSVGSGTMEVETTVPWLFHLPPGNWVGPTSQLANLRGSVDVTPARYGLSSF